ncbi:MAG: hypothetical protein AAGF59_03135 [Pseudomonadota bacterium]
MTNRNRPRAVPLPRHIRIRHGLILLLLAGLSLIAAQIAAHSAQKDVDLSEEIRAEIERLEPLIGRQEIPRFRIGWYVNDSIEAYRSALLQEKPMVAYFHAPLCNFCNRLIEKFQCPSLNRFAGRAVFSLTTGSFEGGGDRGGLDLATALSVDRYPSILVLRPKSDQLVVIGEFVGEGEVQELGRWLEKTINGEKGAGPSEAMLSNDALEQRYRDEFVPFDRVETCPTA